MFCQKCGKQLNDDAAFCHGCGAKVNTSKTESQPQPQAQQSKEPTPQKKKSNVIIILIVVIVAGLFGKFVIAPSLSGDSDGDSGSSSKFIASSNENDGSLSGAKTRVYTIDADGEIDSFINVVYFDDDTVGSIIGNITFITDNADSVEDALSQLDEKNSDNVKITKGKTDSTYSITLSFTNLNLESNADVSKEAASNLNYIFGTSLSDKEGKLYIEDVENTLIEAKYTFKEEF